MTGNGLVTLTPAGAGLESLYSPEEVVYFESVEDLAEKVRYFKKHEDEAVRIARRGGRKLTATYSAASVAAFILGVTLQDESYRTALVVRARLLECRAGEAGRLTASRLTCNPAGRRQARSGEAPSSKTLDPG